MERDSPSTLYCTWGWGVELAELKLRLASLTGQDTLAALPSPRCHSRLHCAHLLPIRYLPVAAITAACLGFNYLCIQAGTHTSVATWPSYARVSQSRVSLSRLDCSQTSSPRFRVEGSGTGWGSIRQHVHVNICASPSALHCLVAGICIYFEKVCTCALWKSAAVFINYLGIEFRNWVLIFII